MSFSFGAATTTSGSTFGTATQSTGFGGGSGDKGFFPKSNENKGAFNFASPPSNTGAPAFGGGAFSFGAAKTESSGLFSGGQAATTTSAFGAAKPTGFGGFSSPPNQTVGSPGFGQPATQTAPQNLSFGGGTLTQQPAPAFGTPTTQATSFGSPAVPAFGKPGGAFSFSTPASGFSAAPLAAPTTTAQTTQSGFGFGGSPGGFGAKPAFSFGGGATTTAAPAPLGFGAATQASSFSFNQAPQSTPGPTQQTTAFGLQTAPPAFGAQPTANTQQNPLSFGTNVQSPTNQNTAPPAFGANVQSPANTAAPPAFGTSTQALSFGGTTTAQTTGLSFGQPAQPTQSSGLGFGTSPQTSTGLSFGPPKTGLNFGAPTSTPQLTGLNFGATSAPAATTQAGLSFGTAPTSKGLNFGTATTTQSSGLSFGTATTKSGLSFAPPASTGTGLGGAATSTQSLPTSGLSFGTTAPAQTAPVSFGGTTTSQAVSQPVSFGGATSAAQTTAASALSNALSFGATSTAAPTGLSFGAVSTAAPTGLSFGAVSTAAPTGLSFGAVSTAAPTGLSFGAVSTAASTGLSFGTGTTGGLSFGKPTTTTATSGAASTSAPSGITALGKPTTSLGLTTATTTTAAPPQPVTSINFAQLEENMNKWTLELEEQERVFINQATQINAWDRLLISNGEKIVELNDAVETMKNEQQSLDHEIDFVLAQQKELEELLAPMEKEVLGDTTERLRDPEREHMYTLAENLDTQLKQMSEDLKEVIEHLNETNRSQDSNDPIVQIGRILNAHMSSMQWVDNSIAQISTKLDQLKATHDTLRRDNERSFQLTYN